MTSEERLRANADRLRAMRPRIHIGSCYLDEVLTQAADDMRAQARTIGELCLSQATLLDRLRDRGLDLWDLLIVEARLEAFKAIENFPQPNYVISKVAEEAGEVVKAAIHCAEGRETRENLRGEMVQLLAMLYRLWIEGDQVHGLPPVRSDDDDEPGAP